MRDVIAELQLDMTPAQLADEITVSNPSDTRYIVIDVRMRIHIWRSRLLTPYEFLLQNISPK